MQRDAGCARCRRPASPKRARRRVIVATNIAETSLTVRGVSAVIDTGLQKVARYDADRGVDSLTTERITLDSADQRAGRAARLGPGIVRRLWDARDRLRPHREAEIHRVDLSAPLLSILAWGAAPDTFEWFDRPCRRAHRVGAGAARAARRRRGRPASRDARPADAAPAAPSAARAVLIAATGSFEGCAACAWLSEPTPLEVRRTARRHRATCCRSSIGGANAAAPATESREHCSASATALVGTAYRDRIDETELRRALLAGYPDRVAKRGAEAQTADDRVTLATGHGAVIGRESGVHDADWLIALDVDIRPRVATTRRSSALASRIEPEWLTPTRSDVTRAEMRRAAIGQGARGRWYDELELREHPVAPDDDDRARAAGDSLARARSGRRQPAPAAAACVRRRHRSICRRSSRRPPPMRTLARRHRRSRKTRCRGTSRQRLREHAPERADRAERPRDDDRLSRRRHASACQ